MPIFSGVDMNFLDELYLSIEVLSDDYGLTREETIAAVLYVLHYWIGDELTDAARLKQKPGYSY